MVSRTDMSGVPSLKLKLWKYQNNVVAQNKRRNFFVISPNSTYIKVILYNCSNVLAIHYQTLLSYFSEVGTSLGDSCEGFQF